MPSIARTAATALLSAATAAAHGFVTGVYTEDGEFHQGWDPSSGMGYDKFPDVVGWSTTVQDEGFVSVESYDTPDIACHRGAEPAALSVEVAPGGVLTLQWNTWPESHHGPIIDYLAACGAAGCAEADKETLEWFKISAVGCEEPDGVDGNPGVWASDLLMANSNKWQVIIPEDLKAGGYVLRHEILALHEPKEPQNYPQCINLEITGDGTQAPTGVVATELYDATDSGIDFDIYSPFDSYTVPGPAMIAGANPIHEQGTGVGLGAGPTEGEDGDYDEGLPLPDLSDLPLVDQILPEVGGGDEAEEEEPAESASPANGVVAGEPEDTYEEPEETDEEEPVESSSPTDGVVADEPEVPVETPTRAPSGGSCLARRRSL